MKAPRRRVTGSGLADREGVDMSKSTCTVPDCEKPRKANGGALCSMHRARWVRHGTLELVGRAPVPVARSIAERVVKGPGCWSWTGHHDKSGYAKLRRGKQNIPIHRWMYEAHAGALTDGLVVDHACGNPGCVNPDHMRQVSIKQNVEHFTTALRSSNTSGYRGVSFHKASGLWVARVQSGDRVRATYHHSAAEAGVAAQQMRLAMHTHNDLDRVA